MGNQEKHWISHISSVGEHRATEEDTEGLQMFLKLFFSHRQEDRRSVLKKAQRIIMIQDYAMCNINQVINSALNLM